MVDGAGADADSSAAGQDGTLYQLTVFSGVALSWR
jgi:hypothetical protein